MATPLVADVNGDGTDDVLVVDGSRRHPLPPGHPRPARQLRAARDGQSRHSPRATSPGCRTPLEGPLLASVDAQDDAVSLYAYRDGAFVRVGSLATGQLPAQVIAADLDGNGWDDLVVRNAGDGTLSVFLNNGEAASRSGFDRAVPAAR